MTSKVELRDYQRETLEAVSSRYRAGVRRLLVCLPTGTGKTVIFAQFPAYFRMKRRMLVLAHREELLDQAREKIMRANPSLQVDIEQADRRARPDSQVVIASIPTLGRAGSKRLQQLAADDFFLIVVDEAHHATAATYRRVLDHFGVFEPGTAKLLVGFTATPARGDGEGLKAVFEEISFSRTLPEMVSQGFLAPLVGYRIETDVDLSEVASRQGDYVIQQLADLVNTDPRNALVVNVFKRYLQDRKTLVFCVNVPHAEMLAAMFRGAGISAQSVTGEMPREQRTKVLSDFRAGRLQVITNCMVLTEGYDEPSVSGVILARPTRSTLLYTQMIGRGTRLSPGKNDVCVIDIVDVTREHKLTTLPMLFGLPHKFDLAGVSTTKTQQAVRWVESNRPWVRIDKAVSLEDLRFRCTRIDLLDLQTPEEIELISSYAWIETGHKSYRLGLTGGDGYRVVPTILGDWEVVLRANQIDRSVHRAKSPESGIRFCDAHLQKTFPDQVKLVDRDTHWRSQPASDKQISAIIRRKIDVPARITKGQASHLIGMLSPGTSDSNPSPRDE